MQTTRKTIIGFFSEAWDARRCLEDLRLAGFSERVRYIQNENPGHGDSTKDKPEMTGFFAKIYGFDDESEYLDARGNWTVSPEAESYFVDAFHRKHHVLLVQTTEIDTIRAIEIIGQHNGKPEEQSYAFFQSATGGVEGGRPVPYPPLSAIEPSLDPRLV